MLDSAVELVPSSRPLETYPYAYDLKNLCLENPFEKTIAGLRAKVAPFRFRLAAKNMAEELGIRSGNKILEIGSGLGLLGRAIKDSTRAELSYTGIDLVYQSAKESNKVIASLQASAENLPFADNSFDGIVSTDVLEHIPHAELAIGEMFRVMKAGSKAFIVIADPSEARFTKVPDHIKRSKGDTDTDYWEELFSRQGFKINQEISEKYRRHDWRKIFNLPFLVKLKDKPGFACAFNPVNRPGVYILEKPMARI